MAQDLAVGHGTRLGFQRNMTRIDAPRHGIRPADPPYAAPRATARRERQGFGGLRTIRELRGLTTREVAQKQKQL